MTKDANIHTVHSAGKLTFTESEIEPNRFRIQANGNWLMSITHNGEQVESRQRENLRRLVACWNAFEGVSTEDIGNTPGIHFPEVKRVAPIAAEPGVVIIEMDCGAIQSTISKGVTANFVIIDRAAEFADEDSIVQIDGEHFSVHLYSANGGDDEEVDRVLAQLGNHTAEQSSTP